LFSIVPTTNAVSSSLLSPGEADEAHPMLYIFIMPFFQVPTSSMLDGYFKLPNNDSSTDEDEV